MKIIAKFLSSFRPPRRKRVVSGRIRRTVGSPLFSSAWLARRFVMHGRCRYVYTPPSKRLPSSTTLPPTSPTQSPESVSNLLFTSTLHLLSHTRVRGIVII